MHIDTSWYKKLTTDLKEIEFKAIVVSKHTIGRCKLEEFGKQGKSIREIAKEMGIHRSKVERTLKMGVFKTLETCMS